MPEPRTPSNDFERWLASSLVSPDRRRPDELCDGISAALKSRELECAVELLKILAFADPRKAQTVYGMMMAALDGDVDRAVLLAVLGG